MYSGDSWRGHYRGAIKMGQVWLLHDDNQTPTSHTALPLWFNQGIAHVWLLRADKLRHWNEITLPPTAASNEAQHVHCHFGF